MSDHIEELLPGYAAETLLDEERSIVEAHLAGCEACRASSREWCEVARAVRLDVATRSEPLPDLEPILARIALRTPRGAGDDLDVNPAAGLDDAAPNKRSRRAAPWLLMVLALLPGTLWWLEPARTAGDGGRGKAATMAPRFGHFAATVVARRERPANEATSATIRSIPVPAAPAVAQRSAVTPIMVPLRADPELAAAADLALTGAPTGQPSGVAVDPPENRGPPKPAAPALAAAVPVGMGTITGRVAGPDGAPRAEIRVRADPLQPGPPVEAYTEPDGRYELAVAPGGWVVHVDSPAYQLEWFGGRPTPFESPVIEVAGGAPVAGIDFTLRPYAGGRVSGRVTAADGTGVARALIVAVQSVVDDSGAGDRGYRAAAFSGADGAYTLYLVPGEYAVGVTADWRQAPGTWWRSATDMARADPLRAGEDGATAVDIVLR